MERWQARTIAVARFGDDRHLPVRRCLGCGGSAGDGGYVQCDARGVEFTRGFLGMAHTGSIDRADWYEEYHRFTWAELARVKRLHDIGQQEMFS
jgi:hypothetical protein